MARVFECDIRNSVSVLIKLWILGFTFQSRVFANNCTTTEIHGNDVMTRLREIKPTGVMDYPTDIDHDSIRLDVTMCPDNGSLKIVFNTNTTEGSNVQICYKMNAVFNGRHIGTACYKLQLTRSFHPLTVSCWFPMTHFSERPIINAWAESSNPGGSRHYVGYLNTALLEPDKPCGNVCEVTALLIPNLMSCRDTAFIKYEKDVHIKRVTFVQKNNTRNELDIFQKSEGQVQYFLNCSQRGEANIQVLYHIRDQYCLKYQPVLVMCTECEIGTVTNPPSDDGSAFGTFVSYGIACIITTTLIVVLIIVVVQNKERIIHCFSCSNGDMDPETFPMNPNNHRHRVTFEEPPTTSASSITSHGHIKRGDSMSSCAKGASNDAPVRPRSAKVARLQRSATVSLLQVTDPLYRKKILFLPSIWDQFSRDVTNILKQLFAEGAKVTAQCCYDRDVYQQYMTGDKFGWIEHLLGDRDKIVVFLCFTNLDKEAKSSDEIDMFEDVLSHLLRTRNMSHLLCKVTYLHLTDSENSQLERNHHGDSYRINNSDSFAVFLRDTMVNCGLRPDEANPLSQTLFNSTPSKEFLSFIGIGGEQRLWFGEDTYNGKPYGRQISTSVRL